MNDLSGLSWDSTPSNPQQPRPNNVPNYAALRPTPPQVSRQATPLSEQHSGRSTPPTGPSGVTRSSGQDSFSNLLPTKKTAQLSLQERQKQLIEERARQQAEQQRQHKEQFKLDDSKFWEELGRNSGTTSPAPNGIPGSSAIAAPAARNDDEDDILAAFNSSAPVDKSSHFPPARHQDESFLGYGLEENISNNQKATAEPRDNQPRRSEDPHLGFDDDDDPFGLGQVAPATTISRTPVSASISDNAGDDDVLGMLGKPVEEVSRARESVQASAPISITTSTATTTEPRDQAIAELVDMGFSVDQSRDALDQTESGVDVQAAVSWILNQAHSRSKNKSRTGANEASGTQSDVLNDDRAARTHRKSQSRQGDNKSPAGNTDVDISQRATQLGNTFFKTANSLWKTGQKRMQMAVAEFQQEADPSQPRWMTQPQPTRANSQQDTAPERQSNVNRMPVVTDEAVLLDSERPASRPNSNRRQPVRQDIEPQPLAQSRPRIEEERTPSLPSRPSSRPVERVSKQSIEEQSARAYVSPARRKKAQTQAPPPPSQPRPEREPELDIFSAEVPVSAARAKPASEVRTSGPTASKASPSLLRPAVGPTRQIPTVSPSSLSQSTGHRVEGTAAFKRGDYASAYSSYTSAIAPLPKNHPIAIVLYCNRSLTSLKTGDPKAAMADAGTALEIIGPSRGEGEAISIDPGEPEKPMKEFYGKAIMRKAEALENMEKWGDAAKVWQDAIEVGIGGAISIQGRNRCERASGGTVESETPSAIRTSASTVTKRPLPVKPRPKPRSAADDFAAPGAKPTKAVETLRAANAAAEAAADEAFAINDSVEGRLNSWKNGKEGNLRALLASLDDVLWENAGWTKVGMGDLVLPNRCKIVYMKAIGKVHPDKIPTNATTEQRMISASVFATLNEAWDRFKRDNGL